MDFEQAAEAAPRGERVDAADKAVDVPAHRSEDFSFSIVNEQARPPARG
jgi:hypothetical protein